MWRLLFGPILALLIVFAATAGEKKPAKPVPAKKPPPTKRDFSPGSLSTGGTVLQDQVYRGYGRLRRVPGGWQRR